MLCQRWFLMWLWRYESHSCILSWIVRKWMTGAHCLPIKFLCFKIVLVLIFIHSKLLGRSLVISIRIASFLNVIWILKFLSFSSPLCVREFISRFLIRITLFVLIFLTNLPFLLYYFIDRKTSIVRTAVLSLQVSFQSVRHSTVFVAIYIIYSGSEYFLFPLTYFNEKHWNLRKKIIVSFHHHKHYILRCASII